MKLVLALAALAPASAFVAPQASAPAAGALRADASSMDGILAPVGFFDPLGLSKSASEETLNWYRAAEIKHGRGDSFASVGTGQLLEFWDKTPAAGRLQIISTVGAIEYVFESQQPHYLRGGTPGAVRLTRGVAPWHEEAGGPGYDPMAKYDAATRKTKRDMELQNGRLAMLGMASFVAASKIPGSVPVLAGLGFAGDYAGALPSNPLPSSFFM
ncbi:chlorophyll A-B binding protein [Aureococcus anophagefferens]|nr:chlorophyll A-B binding protein [Aureococcus anophagefferens]